MKARESSILAIDTALGQCSVALLHNGHVISLQGTSEQSQAAQLMGLVEQLLARTQLDYSQLDSLLTCIGPGSFTGIRIGVSAARALRLALNIPCHGILSLDALAQLYAKDASSDTLHTVLRAGKGQVYHRTYRIEKDIITPTQEPNLYTPEAISSDAPWCGNAQSQCPDAPWIKTVETPLAEGVLLHHIQNEENTLSPEPFYIRPPDAIAAKPLFA